MNPVRNTIISWHIVCLTSIGYFTCVVRLPNNARSQCVWGIYYYVTNNIQLIPLVRGVVNLSGAYVTPNVIRSDSDWPFLYWVCLTNYLASNTNRSDVRINTGVSSLSGKYRAPNISRQTNHADPDCLTSIWHMIIRIWMVHSYSAYCPFVSRLA